LRLPHIEFDVVAGQGSWTSAPLNNLHFHGWQTDMERFYRNTCVVVRLAEHDGVSTMVEEGLRFARHVLYSYPFPHTTHIVFGDVEQLVKALRNLFERHEAGRLEPNVSGWAYAIREFDEARNARTLVTLLSETRRRAADHCVRPDA
jgi:glycosyltransferase involved in cell wall biosynthesis